MCGSSRGGDGSQGAAVRLEVTGEMIYLYAVVHVSSVISLPNDVFQAEAGPFSAAAGGVAHGGGGVRCGVLRRDSGVRVLAARTDEEAVAGAGNGAKRGVARFRGRSVLDVREVVSSSAVRTGDVVCLRCLVIQQGPPVRNK